MKSGKLKYGSISQPPHWSAAAGLVFAWWQTRAFLGCRHAAILAVIFAALVTFLPPLTFGWWYETNDDVFLRFISEARFSADRNLNVFLVFSNIVLGNALQTLYAAQPAVAWYDVFQTACVFIACAVSAFSIARCNPPRIALVISLVCLAALLVSASARHQFTIIASCLTGAGCCLLLSELLVTSRGRLEAWATYLVASCSLLIGSLIRFESFLLCVFACIPALILGATQRRLRFWLLPVITLAVSVAAAVAVHTIDRQVYRTSSEWAGFWQQNSARTNLTEYLRTNADGRATIETIERLEAAGMSKNDRDLLSNFFFSNRQFFGPEKLAVADRATSTMTMNSSMMKQTVATNIARLMLDWRYAVPFLLIAFVALTWSDVLMSLLLCGFAFLSILVLALVFKPIPFRVAHGFYYASTLAAWLSVMCAPRTGWLAGSARVSSRLGALGAVGLTGFAFIGAIMLLNSTIAREENTSVFLSQLSRVYTEDFDRLTAPRIVVVGGWLPYELVFRPFQPTDPIRKTDFQLTGWIDQTPFQQRSLASRGISDLLLDACQDARSEIVASSSMLPLFRRYLDEHYAVLPEFTRQGSFRALQVFRCQLRQPSNG